MNWFLCTCVLFLAILESTSARHRHRHRHRNRAFHQKQLANSDLFNNDFTNVDNIMKAFEEELKTLTDGPTIKEDVVELTQKNVTFPKNHDFADILRSQIHLLSDVSVNSNVFNNLDRKVLDSITRTLRFYDSQLDEITQGDTSFGLKVLKEIDDKHGKVLQKKFPLGQWIQRNCDSASHEGKFCMSLVRIWKNRSGGKSNSNMEYWKPAFVLQNYLNQIDEKTLENIGDEKEGLWELVNVECQEALVNRCEIPHVCERILLDPVPRSQYLLTHQLLQRLFIDNADCPNLRSFVTKEDMYTKLCAKAYTEAQYLDLLGVPITQRDLFAELVGFCGYLGYTNFLREDWLTKILSWQSKSDSGCFVEDQLSPIGLLTTDMGFKRRATKRELEQGIEDPNEKCLPHLTAVALTALTAYWDYMMDLKSHQLVVGDRSEF